jgi:hypothetical protein
MSLGLTGFTVNVQNVQVDLSYIFQNGNYTISFDNGVEPVNGYVMSYVSSNYNLLNFSTNTIPLSFDTTNELSDTFTNCLLTTNSKQNGIDLSYIQVIPLTQNLSNYETIGWLRSKYYIYQYPNLTYLDGGDQTKYKINNPQLPQMLNLHTSVVGFKFLVIGGGGAGQNAGGQSQAPIVGFGGSGGGCMIGYYNFVPGDSKTLTITIGAGGVAGSSGQYDPATFPYFGNPNSYGGSQSGQNGGASSITFNNNYINAGGGPGGTGSQPGSTSSTNITSFFKYDSTSPLTNQVGSDSGFSQACNDYSQLRHIIQLIQPCVYQVTSHSQIIFPYHYGSTQQRGMSYMYGNNYLYDDAGLGDGTSDVYSDRDTNVGSGGYGGCRHDAALNTIGYYGVQADGGSSSAGPGSAGAPGLILIVPQFTTITSLF